MELRIPAPQLMDMHARLLSAAPEEAAAFIRTEPSGDALVVRDYKIFDRDEMDQRDVSLQLGDNVQAEALADVKRSGHTLIEVHTHPFSPSSVRFSAFDLEQLPAFSRYVRLKMPGRQYGALVVGPRGYEGLLWERDEPVALRLRPVGEQHAQPTWLASRGEAPIGSRYDRQVRALGAEGQRRLQQLRVGVVGLGGTGSLVVQQLAHLGIRDFFLVDDDRVDTTNLPRLAGATWWDAVLRNRKSYVARRVIRRIAGKAEVRTFGTLRSAVALAALRDVDLIVGCVDNDGARLIMSELAAAHLMPYLDIGVAVERSGSSAVMGGRVSFYLPGGPCLACADDIDFAEVAEDLESEAQRRIRIARGYARDRAIEPALMPLNTVCVGLAMTELLAFATGMRPVQPYSRYDGVSNQLVRVQAELNPDCPVCGPAHGMGDRQGIERYAI